MTLRNAKSLHMRLHHAWGGVSAPTLRDVTRAEKSFERERAHSGRAKESVWISSSAART
jgi:hypothetical protein